MVRVALELGYRHIDTAQAYDNEQDVGRGIKASGVPRSEVFVTTKLEHAHLRGPAVGPALQQSLKRLGLDYVDQLMIHWPSDDIPLSDTLDAFARLRTDGLIRHIGVCNFTLRHLRECVDDCGITPLCNQVEYHPFLSQARLLPYLAEVGTVLVAYSPLARGQVPSDPTLQRIGARHGKSAAQVALAWLLAQPLVGAIPKASGEANCIANAESFDFRLTPEDLAEIAALPKDRRIINPSWAPRWD
jgi:2,5-diketo-D-gluconate reductase B